MSLPPSAAWRTAPRLPPWAAAALLLHALACQETVATPALDPRPELDRPAPSSDPAEPDSDSAASSDASDHEPNSLDPACEHYATRFDDRLPEEVAASSAPRAPARPPALSKLTTGPIVGAVTSDGATFWVQSDSAADWSLRLRRQDRAELRELSGPPLLAAGDFSAALRVSELRPGQHYVYSIALRPRGSALNRHIPASAEGQFRTLAADHAPGHTRFAVGADIAAHGSQTIFRQIAEVAPDFLLLIGDQVYADDAGSRAAYAKFYKRNWNIKHLRPLLANVPTFMIWDDHEISDNYSAAKADRYPPARAAYDLYVQAHNPPPLHAGDLYYRFRSGDLAFFVLDVRSHRASNRAPDDANKTMLGRQQRRDLLDWLRCEPAALKVIVSPVIWSDWAQTGRDAWLGFVTEREELLEFIATEANAPVLLISGDQHWSAVFRFERQGYVFYEFLPTPLSKGRSRAPSEDSPEILVRDDDNFVFGVVDVDTRDAPPSIALTLCALDRPCRPGEEPAPQTSRDLEGDADNVPFTVRLSANDLGRRAIAGD